MTSAPSCSRPLPHWRLDYSRLGGRASQATERRQASRAKRQRRRSPLDAANWRRILAGRVADEPHEPNGATALGSAALPALGHYGLDTQTRPEELRVRDGGLVRIDDAVASGRLDRSR